MIVFDGSIITKTAIMKNTVLSVPLLALVLFSSCSVIEGIFKAGVWVGIIASAVVVGVVIWIIMKVSGRK